MKVLFIGPRYGGIKIYTQKLIHELRDNFDIKCSLVGISKPTFNLSAAQRLLTKLHKKIINNNADIIHFQFGTYDLEQLLLMPEYKINNLGKPIVYTVHSLDWFLLKKLGYSEKKKTLRSRIKNIPDAYVFFGKYSKNVFAPLKTKRIVVSLHPAVWETKDKQEPLPLPRKFAALLGYSARWKDYKTLIEAISLCKENVKILIAGKWWGEKIKEGVHKVNRSILFTLPREFNNRQFNYIIRKCAFGLFPYKSTPDFQCSGILPVFIESGKAALVTKTACLPEYVTNHSLVIPEKNPKALAKALDYMWRQKLTNNNIITIKKFYDTKMGWKLHCMHHQKLYEKLYVR